MSDISELWSEPWHALLRRLAATVTPVIGSGAKSDRGSALSPRATAGEVTWLVRARDLAAAAAAAHARLNL